MTDTKILEIEAKLDHIKACAEAWDGSGVSRFRAITRTADEIRRLVESQEK